MTYISVVIPFYQRKNGILSRALRSILNQKIPDDVSVHVVVVDDGSPICATEDSKDLIFKPPFHLEIIKQENSGVSAARNTGLKAVQDKTDYLAFIDSDDIWTENHLSEAIEALDQGYDFYFSDHTRKGHHDSYFKECCPKIFEYVKQEQKISPIDQSSLLHLLWRHFPSQASTVVYRWRKASDISFREGLKASGEDVLFFTDLTLKCEKICFNKNVMVECADGINMFFGHFSWDDPQRVKIIHDQIKTFTIIKNQTNVSKSENKYLFNMVKSYENDLVFFALRSRIKNKEWPKELSILKETKALFLLWFLKTILWTLFAKKLGFYKPVF